MKKIFATFTLALVFNATAQAKYIHPAKSEIAKNRACFKDLEVQGCRNQEEDPEQFKSCLSNVVESLDDHCKKLMFKLYGE